MLTRMAPLLTRMARMLTRMTRWLAYYTHSMLIMPSVKKSLIVEQFQGNYLKSN